MILLPQNNKGNVFRYNYWKSRFIKQEKSLIEDKGTAEYLSTNNLNYKAILGKNEAYVNCSSKKFDYKTNTNLALCLIQFIFYYKKFIIERIVK